MAVALAMVLAVAGLALVAPADEAEAASLPASILEGGYIISDEAFFDGDAMTASQIQKFLNAKVTTCKSTNSALPCLKSFTGTLPAKAADKYCKAIAKKTGATAAQVIAAVAVACNISPKVILVMLQKEQGLVTSTAPSSWAYRAAMGQSCPDTAPCDAAAAGFINQVYLGARQQQIYAKNPTSFNYRAGQVNTIKWHPSSSCGTSKVYIQNQATANLYIYTPYRANVAALAAGYGTGDSCSAYGNRNFYNYYVSWFEPTASTSTGAPALVKACQQPLAADIASSSGTGTVTSDTLNARTAPTLVCSSGMTTLKKGAKVTVTGKYSGWTRAKTSAGDTVWLSSAYLKLTDTSAPAGSSSPCAVPSASSITAASGTVQVTTSSLNVRTAPSTSCDTGKIQLAQGVKATLTGTYGVWWQITYSGKSYWAHSDYLAVVAAVEPVPSATATPKPTASATATPKPTTSATPTATPTPTASADPCTVSTSGLKSASGTYVVKSGTITARKAPSTSCAKGAVKATSTTVMTRTGTFKDFTRVKIGSSTLWVKTSQITAATVVYTNAKVNFRAKASTSSTSYKMLAKGTKAVKIGTSGVWRKVIIGSKIGWVHSAYLTTTKPTTSTTTSKSMTTTASVNLRSGASTSTKSLTVLTKGTKVTVTSSSGVWRKVKVGSRTGWVHSAYLK
ncbi:SH3 domain-containing protein [Microbacterium fluvii]|uniref:SH3 domain-containing protein n=1 Tax=Microbacterium fluvii TaxID=415215 RepID=A0ABW2H8Z2_9MICO|nr:SH3 domain-containing protein [Microbacterium fluvii]MCU4671414.1 SH3 domain-containing protein [Microbacterium fluvii]